MTRKPISVPISFFALFATAALAAPPSDRPITRVEEQSVSTDPSPCQPGQAMTYKLQCGPTTRTPFERFVNNAGVEACVVLPSSGCEPQVVPVNINDPTQPTALVIFGVRQLLPGDPQ